MPPGSQYLETKGKSILFNRSKNYKTAVLSSSFISVFQRFAEKKKKKKIILFCKIDISHESCLPETDGLNLNVALKYLCA